ncbi:integrase arm-type DNA-binding domain-containing protein [Acinetobacter sp. HC8-3S]
MSANRVKLTKSFIDQLELKPAIFRDSELIGFAVRVNTSYKTYIVEKKVNGRSTRSTLGIHGQITLAQARVLAQEALVEMTKGVNLNEKKKSRITDAEKLYQVKQQQPTLVEAYSVYIDERELKPRTLDDYSDVINGYLSDWKDIKLKDINRKMIQDKHKELSERSKAQANMVMRVFRAIYNFSIEHYLDDDENPILPPINPVRTLTAKKLGIKLKEEKHTSMKINYLTGLTLY